MNKIAVKDFDTTVQFELGDGKVITVAYYLDDSHFGLIIDGHPNLNIAPIDESSIFVESVD